MAPLMQDNRMNPHITPRPTVAAAIRPNGSSMPWAALVGGLLLLLATAPVRAQMVINTDGAAPTSDHAILELKSVTQGLLTPRMTRTQRNTLANPPSTVAPNGTLIYQSDNSGTDPSGLYYFNAALLPSGNPIGWVRLGLGADVWKVGGNAGTNASTNFLGTVNNYPLVFRTRNREAGRLTETGKLQLYSGSYPAGLTNVYPSSANTEMVHVQGAVKLGGGNNPANTNTGNLAGTIRFNPGTGGEQPRFEGYVLNTPASMAGWKQIDNNFQMRPLQETTNTAGGCLPPTSTTNPGTSPRPWPATGPTTGAGSLGGGAGPFYGLWEDSRQQFLYRADELSATGMCPGPDNPILGIAFNITSVNYGGTRQHFMLVRIKNTMVNNIVAYDNAALVPFHEPATGKITAPPPTRYYNPYPPGAPITPPSGNNNGVNLTTGWFPLAYDQGGSGFVWVGQNLLIDTSVDNQDWPIMEPNVQSYNSGYNSLIYLFCDACGNTGGSSGNGSCKWWSHPTLPATLPAGYFYPPTTPDNGYRSSYASPGTGSSITNVDGWGWVAGRNLSNGVSTVACDGQSYTYGGSGTPAIRTQLPRVAFLTNYVGGGTAYDVGSYMYANEALMVGDATWAASGTYGPPTTLQHRGPGTINAQRSVWSDNLLLTDYVFDLYYDGVARPEDAKGADNYSRVPLRELPSYMEQNRKLPNVDGRETWNDKGIFSLDQITNQLWVAAEDQALYILELNERMDALRQYLVEKKLNGTTGK